MKLSKSGRMKAVERYLVLERHLEAVEEPVRVAVEGAVWDLQAGVGNRKAKAGLGDKGALELVWALGRVMNGDCVKRKT